MKKGLIILVVLLAVAGAWWVYNRRKGSTGDCIRIKPGKFAAWPAEDKIPHGDLRRIAEKYLEGDAQENGALVGGFLKSINTYPDMNSAKYYQREMKAWVASDRGLPHWSVIMGESLCKN